MSNRQKPTDSKVGLEEISRKLLTHSLLSEPEISQVLESLSGTGQSVTAQGFLRQAVKLGKLTLFQAKLLLSQQAVVLSLGPYAILDKLGQGGMGTVYQARHKSMGRVVALKVLRRRNGFTEDVIRRFEREIVAAAKLIHPNIVTAFDAGEQNGLHYLVMEYVPGWDLKTYLDKHGPFSLGKALRFVLQVARGMQYAHDKQIIHRDIKPANLLVDNGGCVKILDLGLARIIRDSTVEETQEQDLTADGALMGTVDFLSPEQSLDTKTADARSDIYSLGCTLFTLLTGRPVFPGGSLVQKILAHRETPAPSLRTFRPDIPAALDNLFLQMLAKSPEDRPQSMAVVASALQQILTEVEGGSVDHGVDTPSIAEEISPATVQSSEEETVKGASSQVTLLPQTNPVSGMVFPEIRPSASRRQPIKQAQGTYWHFALGFMGLTALLVLGWFLLPNSVDSRLRLRFDPNQVTDLAGAVIWIDQSARGEVEGTITQELDFHIPADYCEVRIEKPGYESFSRVIQVSSSGTLEIPVSLTRKIQDPPSNATPQAPTPATIPSGAIVSSSEIAPQITDSAPHRDSDSEAELTDSKGESGNSRPLNGDGVSLSLDEESEGAEESFQASEESTRSRVLIVGLGTGEIPDLDSAFQQAQPNDTILIRHRGPLTFSSTDLSGKTPLTITGGERAGVDYWPIIRQKKSLPETEGGGQESSRPLFFGDKIDLYLKKLHLACGGAQRDVLSSLIECNSGAVSLEDCTVTASTDDATRFAAGAALPLVKLSGSASQHLDLTFTRSLVRGARLKSLVSITSEASVAIVGEQFLWAGGNGPLIELGHGGSHASLRLKQSTIYNFASLLDIPGDRFVDNSSDSLFDVSLQGSVLVSQSKGASSFVEISQGNGQSLTKDNWRKLVNLSSEDSIAANMDSWLPTTDPLLGFADFLKLYELDKRALIDTLPKFRVSPAGVELQEVEARDLEVLQARGNRKPADVGQRTGIDVEKLPRALTRISERLAANGDEVKQPRGLPVVIEVSKKNGPVRSLEEAFKQMQGEDVEIVITDSETYIPGRNFDLDNRMGVLSSESVPHLTIRAADGEVPMLVISDSPSLQVGNLPRLDHWVGSEPQLFLINFRGQSLKIQGFRFTTEIVRNTRHSVFLTTAHYVRMTNCQILDRSAPSQGSFSFHNGYGVTTTIDPRIGSEISELGPAIAWIENVVVDHSMPSIQVIPEHFVTLPTAFSFATRNTSSKHLLYRNCAIGTNQLSLFNLHMNPWIDIENCSLWGRLLGSHSELKSVNVVENIIFCATNPVLTTPAGLVDSTNVHGGNNAVWMGNAPIAAELRNQGPLRWMPGPILPKPPLLDQNLQLKLRQPAATMADDGGPVGFQGTKFPDWFNLLK